jgi:CHAD domain-containing protein
MKTQTLPEHSSFGDCAYQAIVQHFQKSVKHEAEVLKAEDPEPLHQMRVGMRRLRTVINVFGPALELPEAASTKRIRKIARRLGAVRDMDVLKAELETRYRPQLKGKDRKKLDATLAALKKQQHQDVEKLEQTLHSSAYQKFKQAFTDWLEQPTYKPIAKLPIVEVLPDLMLPLISQMLLHPGWLIGATLQVGRSAILENISVQKLDELVKQQGPALHDLRKQMKGVRYQTEFFVDFYSPAYGAQVEDFKQVQELLGQIQDSLVMSKFLSAELKEDIESALPNLAQQMQQERLKTWRTWKPIQQRYLEPEFRAFLRHQVMTPLDEIKDSQAAQVTPQNSTAN